MIGKSDKPNTAVSKAQVDAQKKMVSIARWHYSMPRTIITHYRGTKIVMIARRPGYGVTGNVTENGRSNMLLISEI